jgi:hypothetical protein
MIDPVHLLQEDGALRCHPHFHPRRVLWLRKMQSRRRVRVLLPCQCRFEVIRGCIDPPAPIITLDMPRHNVRKPSTREMVTMALDMPLYMAPGEGLIIWILVFWESALRLGHSTGSLAAAYLEEVDGVHDRVLLLHG